MSLQTQMPSRAAVGQTDIWGADLLTCCSLIERQLLPEVPVTFLGGLGKVVKKKKSYTHGKIQANRQLQTPQRLKGYWFLLGKGFSKKYEEPQPTF